jgi:hypothetical protein
MLTATNARGIIQRMFPDVTVYVWRDCDRWWTGFHRDATDEDLACAARLEDLVQHVAEQFSELEAKVASTVKFMSPSRLPARDRPIREIWADKVA